MKNTKRWTLYLILLLSSLLLIFQINQIRSNFPKYNKTEELYEVRPKEIESKKDSIELQKNELNEKQIPIADGQYDPKSDAETRTLKSTFNTLFSYQSYQEYQKAIDQSSKVFSREELKSAGFPRNTEVITALRQTRQPSDVSVYRVGKNEYQVIVFYSQGEVLKSPASEVRSYLVKVDNNKFHDLKEINHFAPQIG